MIRIRTPRSAERLATIRIGLCAVLALRLCRSVYVQLAEQPPVLFRPISFMRALDGMPPKPVVLTVQIVAIIAAIGAAAGYRTRASLPLAWVGGVFLNGMTTSIGKVVHNDVLLLLAMVPLLVAPVADAWSLDANRARVARSPGGPSERYGWAIDVAMIVVAGAYFFTGWQKITTSGASWFTGSNLRWVLYASSDSQVSPNVWALMLAGIPWLVHVVALVTLVIETGFPLVLLRPRLAWVFVPAAVALHGGIHLAMHLDYSAQIATVLVVFVDWPAVIDRAAGMRMRRRRTDTVTA